MANEFKHKTVGTQYTQTEFEATDRHVMNNQATGDLIKASSATQLERLPIGNAGDLMQVSGGLPVWTDFLAPVHTWASRQTFASGINLGLGNRIYFDDDLDTSLYCSIDDSLAMLAGGDLVMTVTQWAFVANKRFELLDHERFHPIASPPLTAGVCKIYGKDVSAKNEFHCLNEDGVETQLSGIMTLPSHLKLGINQKIILDDDGDTWIYCDGDDRLKIHVGGIDCLVFTGNTVTVNTNIGLGLGINLGTEYAMTDKGATPGIGSKCSALVTNTNPQTITNFAFPSEGQLLCLRFADGNTTLDDCPTIQLSGGIDKNFATGDMCVLINRSSVWYQIGGVI